MFKLNKYIYKRITGLYFKLYDFHIKITTEIILMCNTCFMFAYLHLYTNSKCDFVQRRISVKKNYISYISTNLNPSLNH